MEMEYVLYDFDFTGVFRKTAPLLPSRIEGKFNDASKNTESYNPEILVKYGPVFIFPVQIQTNKFGLKKPLPVTIEKVENLFGVYNEELNISTIGETKEKAIYNFIKFLKQDYLTYKSTPKEKLSEGAKRLLSNYEGWLKDK